MACFRIISSSAEDTVDGSESLKFNSSQDANESNKGSGSIKESPSLILDERAVEDLIEMQQNETLELVISGKVFSVDDVVPHKLYSHKFQTKVADFLLDGGTLLSKNSPPL